jgi:S-adenosyl-L-methionine hydrolase (adenosine-forming)
MVDARPFTPAGLVALTTDFGLDDPYAGIVKGRILGRLPQARIVDLSHGMPAGRPDLAGFWLRLAWRDFPAGTLHLAVVDPGVGTERAILLGVAEGRALLAPDNGLGPEALRDAAAVEWRAMDPALPARMGLPPPSRSFHGRDLFAPLAAELAAGRLAPEDFGPPATPLDPAPLPPAEPGEDGVLGQVVLTDRFGNLITNIPATALEGFHQPMVEVGVAAIPLAPTYGAAPPGATLALVNAFGLLEVAVNGGSAAQRLGLAEGTRVRVRDGLGI